MVNSGRTVGQQLADSFLGDRYSPLFPKNHRSMMMTMTMMLTVFHSRFLDWSGLKLYSLKQSSRKLFFVLITLLLHQAYCTAMGRLFKASVKLFDSSQQTLLINKHGNYGLQWFSGYKFIYVGPFALDVSSSSPGPTEGGE